MRLYSNIMVVLLLGSLIGCICFFFLEKIIFAVMTFGLLLIIIGFSSGIDTMKSIIEQSEKEGVKLSKLQVIKVIIKEIDYIPSIIGLLTIIGTYVYNYNENLQNIIIFLFFSIIVCAVFIFSVTFLFSKFSSVIKIKKYWSIVDAECIDLDIKYNKKGNKLYAPKYRYFYKGSWYTTQTWTYSSFTYVKIGDVISIYVNPDYEQEIYETNLIKNILTIIVSAFPLIVSGIFIYAFIISLISKFK